MNKLANANESAKLARGHLFFAIPIYLYLAVAAATLDDVDFFLASPLTLPIIQTEVPLLAFFWIAPLLVCALNQQLLMQISEFKRRLPEDGATNTADLFPFLPALTIAGDEPRSIVWRLLATASLIGAPLATVMWLQVSFLRYQSEWTSGLHTAATIIVVFQSFAFLRYFGGAPRTPELRPWAFKASGQGHTSGATKIANWFLRRVQIVYVDLARLTPASWRTNRMSALALLLVAAFAIFVATPVGGARDRAILQISGHPESHKACEKDKLLDTSKARGSRLRSITPFWRLDMLNNWIPFRRYIEIEGRDLSNIAANSEETNRSYRVSVDASGRKFRMITLLRVKLTNARFYDQPDFTVAHIDKSDLSGSTLSDGADFTDACLRKSLFNGVTARSARFTRTSMEKTIWEGANLSKAAFDGAKMKHASMIGAHLTDAKFQSETRFERVDARLASFAGACFADTVDTNYASFVGANMRDVSGIGPNSHLRHYFALSDFRVANTSATPGDWLADANREAMNQPADPAVHDYGADGAIRRGVFPEEPEIIGYACALRPMVADLICEKPHLGDALFALYDERELTRIRRVGAIAAAPPSCAPSAEGSELADEAATSALWRELIAAKPTKVFKVQNLVRPDLDADISEPIGEYVDQQPAWLLVRHMHAKMLKDTVCPAGSPIAGKTIYSSLSVQGQRNVDQKLRPNSLAPAFWERAQQRLCRQKPKIVTPPR